MSYLSLLLELILISGLAQAGTGLEKGLFPSPPPRSVPAVRSQPTTAELEQAIYLQVNQYRVSRRLPPLTLDPRVSELAREHSRAMANRQLPVGHQGLKQRARAIARRGIPVRRVGENVAYIFSQNDPAKRAVEGWLRSASHRENLEDDRYSLTGVGVVQNDRGATYFTQIFVRRW